MFDPYDVPPGYWSRKAEELAQADQGWRWPLVFDLDKTRRQEARLRSTLAAAEIDRAVALGALEGL